MLVGCSIEAFPDQENASCSHAHPRNKILLRLWCIPECLLATFVSCVAVSSPLKNIFKMAEFSLLGMVLFNSCFIELRHDLQNASYSREHPRNKKIFRF